MDEADLLGDRISIISNGKLQCCGSPLFLKRHFGKGYFLTVTKDMNYGQNFIEEEISKFICSLVPGAKLHDNFGSELSYVMPSAARLTGEFANLFQNLEENMKNYGIRNYGISDTTLEEVVCLILIYGFITRIILCRKLSFSILAAQRIVFLLLKKRFL